MKKRRVAKYRRVSTKEQAIHGFSLQAQDENLNKYIKDNDYILVGDYVDKGITASTLHRPALQDLLEDVRSGKIDLIIFTKLDRWFRSVSHYYKIQDVLDENKVHWRTVLEDYNTETSDGRFKVNIMLSVAQQELDRTSERIKVVFDSKIKNKQPINGSLPLGYKIGIINGEKRVIKDLDKQEILLDLFTHFEIHQSLKSAMLFLQDKHDFYLPYDSCKRILKNRLYIGEYHGVTEYCEPYLNEQRFNKIQQIFENKKVVKKYKNTYLFSGLIRCAECGGSTAGSAVTPNKGNLTHHYYRCNNANVQGTCDNCKRIAEQFVEKYLLTNIREDVKKYIIKVKVEETSNKKPKYNKIKIESEIERLNNMYQKNRITEEKYDDEFEKLQIKLDECNKSHEKRDLTPLKQFLDNDFEILYKTLSREEKRSLWRSIIKKMIVKDYNDINIEFL